MRAVEEAAYAEADLRDARSLARSGRVGGITVDDGTFLAAVADGDEVWTVSGGLPVLDEGAIETLVETVAAESGRVAALLRRRPAVHPRRARRGGRRRAAALRRRAGDDVQLRGLGRPVHARAGRSLPAGLAGRGRPAGAVPAARAGPRPAAGAAARAQRRARPRTTTSSRGWTPPSARPGCSSCSTTLASRSSTCSEPSSRGAPGFGPNRRFQAPKRTDLGQTAVNPATPAENAASVSAARSGPAARCGRTRGCPAPAGR